MKLKSQNKYRRLKKPFIFILSIILTLSIYSLEGFKNPYRADTYYKGYTTQYGSFSLVETNLFGNTRVQSLFMYAFNGVYNGRIRIYYTQASYNGTDSILPINCTIESRSDSYLQITFKNVSEICIIFQNANLNPIDITSVQYPGDDPMTKVTNGTNNQLETIETILYNIQSTNQTIATNTAGISTTNSQLTTLNNNVNSILSEISDYFTDNNGVTVNIGDIILQFNEFNANLQLQLGILNDLKSALLDIDNKIDTITWKTINRTITYSPAYVNNWQNINNNEVNLTFNNSFSTALGTNRQVIFKITVPITTNNYMNTISVNIKRNGNDYSIDDILYFDYNSYTMVIYINSQVDGSDVILNIKSSGNYLRFTQPSNFPESIQYIDNNDIEYWELLNVFYNYKYKNTLLNKLNELKPIDYNDKLDDIVSAINNLNISVTNTTENDTQVNIENYNDIMTDIEDIEINFNTQFNNNSNSISQNNINAPSFPAEKQLLIKVTNELLMSNTKIKYIIYILLLGFVVIRILG